MSQAPNAMKSSSSKSSLAHKLSALSCSQPPLKAEDHPPHTSSHAPMLHLDDDSWNHARHQHRFTNLTDSEVECSMCGDVGFSSELFRCKKCLHRLQHTYCSRYYPSIPEKDVCDWCSQDTNPSAGSSTAVANSVTLKSRSAPKLCNPGKLRKVADSSSPRKAGGVAVSSDQNQNLINSSSRCRNLCSSSNSLLYQEPHESQDLNKDALELLLEVAQRVAEGQIVTTCERDEQDQNLKSFNHRIKTRSGHQQEPPKKQRSGIQELMKSPGKVQNNNKLQLKAGKDQNHKLQQLTSSRSIGRRYKLLSDVLCPKLAATNPTCG